MKSVEKQIDARRIAETDKCIKEGCYWWWLAIGTPVWEKQWRGNFPLWFRLHGERSAFLYELSARVNGRHEFAKPWLKLKARQWEILSARWPMPERWEDWAVSYATPERKPSANGTAYTCASYNLAKNDETIVSLFREWITSERQRLKISRPTPNKGVNRKPRSWHVLELMDIQRKQIRLLTAGERSQISKAIRHHREYLTPRVKAALR